MKSKSIFMTFWKIINWAGERNRIAKNYGTDDKLYISEIHTLAVIGENPGILQRELCESLGVTKGRISIIVSNLVKKKLVIKMANLNNNKELPLKLSETGETVFKFHEMQEQERNIKINKLIENLSDDELDKFNDILSEVLNILSQ